MTKSLLAVFAASFLLGACATNAVDAAAEPRTEPQYQTGSNIAKHKTDPAADGVSVVSREDMERARDNQAPPSFIPKGK